jgi:hypothetical protein
LRHGDQGWSGAHDGRPRPKRAASGPPPVAPSAPDQRSACNGDRRCGPFLLWAGIWKRFHMFTTDDPELARSPGRWLELTRGPATWDQAGGAVLSFRIWRWRRQRQRRSVLSRGNSVRSERNHAVQNQPQDRSRFARKHRGAGFDGVTVTLITPRRNDRGRMVSTTPRQRKTTGRVMHESRADPEREHVHPSPA